MNEGRLARSQSPCDALSASEGSSERKRQESRLKEWSQLDLLLVFTIVVDVAYAAILYRRPSSYVRPLVDLPFFWPFRACLPIFSSVFPLRFDSAASLEGCRAKHLDYGLIDFSPGSSCTKSQKMMGKGGPTC